MSQNVLTLDALSCSLQILFAIQLYTVDLLIETSKVITAVYAYQAKTRSTHLRILSNTHPTSIESLQHHSVTSGSPKIDKS